MYKILIAGGSGFIGGHLLSGLCAGNDIEAIGRKESRHKYAENIRFTEFDLSNAGKEFYLNGKDYDTAIFLAQSDCYRRLPDRAEELFSVNVMGFLRFIDAVRRGGVKHVIYASSGNVYRPSVFASKENDSLSPGDLYGLSKKMAEEMLGHYADYFKITILRFVFVFGEGQTDRYIPNIIKTLTDGKKILLQRTAQEGSATGGLRSNPIYVKDAVKIIRKIMEDNIEGVFNVAGNEVLSVRQIADIIGGRLGVKPEFQILPSIRPGDIIVDNQKLTEFYREELTPFSAGIRNTLEYRG